MPPRHSQTAPTIRRAGPTDALAIAVVHVRSWQVAYRGLIDDEFLDALDPERRARGYEFGPGSPEWLVAVAGGAIRGFVAFGPSRDEGGAAEAEIRALYVDPEDWRRGVGTLLLRATRDRLRELEFAEAVLWVLRGNEAAERFYLEDGWRRDGAERGEAPYGVSVRVFRMRRPL